MIRSIGDIRPGERRNALAGFLLLFGVMFSHSVLETARDALFLSSLPAARLPFVYLAIAVGGLVLSRLAGQDTSSARNDLVRTLLGTGLATGILWLILADSHTWAVYTLYVWSGVVITIITMRVWSLLGNVFSVSQAKRIFGPIGVGSVLGAIAGSGLAALLASALDARHLVPIAAAGFALTGFAPLILQRDEIDPSSSRDEGWGERLMDDVRLVANRPHAVRIALVVFLSSIGLTMIDWVFKAQVAANVAPEDLGQFFAITYTALNVLSFVAQLVFVSWVVQRLGVTWSLAILPIALIGGGVGVLMGGGLVAAIALKASDGALKHSLHRTATELLYLPLPNDVRTRVKNVIDVLGQRGGQAVASGLILVAAALVSSSAAMLWVAAAALVVLALWVAVAALIGKNYLDLFRDTLSDATIRTRLEFPELDMESLETLMASINSTDDRQVLAAMDLLTEQGRARLVPALILYHPTSDVVVRALQIFATAKRTDFLPIADRLMVEHPDEPVRCAALLSRNAVQLDIASLDRAMSQSGALAIAAQVVRLANGLGDESPEAVLEKFGELGVESGAEARALAEAVAKHPNPLFTDILARFVVAAHDDEVRLSAIEALAGIRTETSARALMPALAFRLLRPPARASLVEIGAEIALPVLAEMLDDRSQSFSLRLHVPRTIGRFHTQDAVDLLGTRLSTVADSRIRYKILRALGRLTSGPEGLRIAEDVVTTAIERNLRDAYLFTVWRHALQGFGEADEAVVTDVHDLLVQMLGHMRRSAIDRLFRLLGIHFPDEDLRSVHMGLRSERRELQASSLELLDHILEPPVREPLLALVEQNLPVVDKIDRGGAYAVEIPKTYPEVLRELLDRPGEGIRALAIHQIGALGLGELEAALPDEAASEGSSLSSIVSRAREQLALVTDVSDPVPST